MKKEFLFKCVIIGDSYTGKTSIVKRLVGNNFNETFQPTIGVDFNVKKNNNFKLQIWDTSGDKRFESIIDAYVKKCDILILVFDLTNKKSFENISEIILKTKPFQKILLLGNKKDLQTNKNFNNFNNFNNLTYEEVSAKTGENIEKAFENFFGKLKTKQFQNQEIVSNFNLCKII